MSKSFNKQEGIALITVLLMVFLILMLMTSLISLTSESLYETTRGVERASLVSLAEAGINEAILKLYGDPNWGESLTHPKSEILVMKSGSQDVNIINPNLDTYITGATYNTISFQGKGFYYISFDPNDPTGYYSVNNLSNSLSNADGWRGSGTVPRGSADIVVTVAVGNTVRHIEIILKSAPGGGIQNGSRGKTFIRANNFTLGNVKKGKGIPNFHANGYVAGTPEVISMAFYDLPPGNAKLEDGATVTANKGIIFPSKPAGFDENQGDKTVPSVDLSTMLIGTTSIVNSGTYVVDASGNLDYTDSTGTFFDDKYKNGDEIAAGAKYTYSKKGDAEIFLSNSIEVPYDASNLSMKSGNLTIIGARVEFEKKASGKDYIYTTSDPGKSKNITGEFIYGNLNIITPDQDVLIGQGNVYCGGDLNLFGKKIDAGYSSNVVSLYSDGDIRLYTEDSTKFRGLVYTKGNFTCIASSSVTSAISNPFSIAHPAPGSIMMDKGFSLEGALIAAGDSTINKDGRLILSAKNISIQVDSSVLDNLTYGGAKGVLTIVSWHEF